MSTAAKVANHNVNRQGTVKSVYVDIGTRACVNCIWYEQYFHKNRGNVACWVPTSTGYCILRDQQRGALRKPCRDYEIPSSSRGEFGKT